MSILNIVIPMAGLGSRFKDYGFSINKYLLPVSKNLDTMISMAITSLVKDLDLKIRFRFIFIIRLCPDSDSDTTIKELEKICNKNNYLFEIKIINHLTEGPASTVYEAKDLLKEGGGGPLIVSNSDQILDWSINKFLDKCSNYDGCVLTYNPNYDLELGSIDKHSFVKFNVLGNNEIIDVQEKIVLSSTALVGVHYYKSSDIFIKSYEYCMKHNIKAPTNNEYYLSLTYKAMLKLGYIVGNYHIESSEHFYPVGEPDDYFLYLKNQYQNQDQNRNNYVIKNSLFSINVLNDIIGPVHDEVSVIIYGTYIEIFFENNKIEIKHKDFKFQNRNKFSINDYTRGWIIGNFEPSIFKTSDFEVGILTHKKNEKWPFHYHKESDEINILLKGSMMLNGSLKSSISRFDCNKNEIACPIFLEDCKILCIKIPSVKNDKYII